MATTTSIVALKQLKEELEAAGVNIANGIGSTVDGSITTVHGYDGAGHAVDLGNSAQGVLDNHVPVPFVDPRIAVIESMESLTDADKAILISLFVV